MSIFFICPSNTRFMPYLSYYDSNIPHDVQKKYIIWDRFSDEVRSSNKLIYQDGLKGHQRGVLEYIRYMLFLYSNLLKLKNKEYKIVVFGFQTTFFLVPYLIFSKNRYVIDVRDYHYLFKLIPSFVFRKAEFIAVSSPAYSKLFNKSTNCIVCHNLYEYDVDLDTSIDHYKLPMNISYMGAIRDFDSQKALIDSLSNNNNFLISFHGVGDIIPSLKKYISEKGINNVNFKGRYDKNDEYKLYESASIINMLRDNKTYNDRVALPNRLYSSAFFKRPSMCYEGSALAEIVKKYSLGLCISYKDNIEESLLNYFNTFSYTDFKKNCHQFLEAVRCDQKLFQKNLQVFIDK